MGIKGNILERKAVNVSKCLSAGKTSFLCKNVRKLAGES